MPFWFCLRSVASGGHVLNCQVGMVGCGRWLTTWWLVMLRVGTKYTQNSDGMMLDVAFSQERNLGKNISHPSKVFTEQLMVFNVIWW